MKPEELVPGGLYVYHYGVRREIVEFAYMGQTGSAICHPPGVPDSWAIDPANLYEIPADLMPGVDDLYRGDWEDSE